MSSIVGAIGIDLGSTRSVIGVAKKGGVDILDNEANFTETPNYVSYGEDERFTGNAGQNKAVTNFRNTVCFSNRLLGITADHPNLKEETKWIPCQTSQNQQTRKVQFDVSYAKEKIQLTPEQVTAANFTKIKSIIRKHGIEDKEAVVSVPTYYTEQERKALIDAAKIAELNVVRVFNESSAIATAYGLFRKSDLDATKPRHVVFVDFGHAKLSAFVASFTKEKLTIISQVNERNLGARDIDWLVFEFYANMFEQDSGLSPLDSKKAQLKLMEAIKKQRQILSGNAEASINLEYLMEDYDLNHTMKREQFEQIGAPVFQKVQDLLNQLSSQISAKKDITIHSVEAVGGAFRIPAIQKIVSETFKQKSVNTTLNASECIAKGCAMMSAMNHPTFRVAEYLVEEANIHPINVSWTFFKPGQMEDEEQKPKSSQLFSLGCSIPNVKSLTFNKSDGIKMSCYYEPPVPGFPTHLASFEVPPAKPTEEIFGVKVRIRLNKNGIVGMQDVNLFEEFTVEEKKEIKQEKKKEEPKKEDEKKEEGEKKEGEGEQKTEEEPKKSPKKEEKKSPKKEEKVEPQYEIVQIKKKREQQMKFQQSNYYVYEKKQLDELLNTEATQKNHDVYIQDLQTRRNTLESYIYSWRDQLDGSKKDYVEAEQIPNLQNLLQTQLTWLEDEDTKNSKSEYVNRNEELTKIFEPIKMRFDQYNALPQALQEHIQLIQKYEDFSLTQEEKYIHLTDEDRKTVMTACNQQRVWLQNAENAQKALQRWNNPVITLNDVSKASKQLIDDCKPIINKPKPLPKKEEPKKEEQPPSSSEKPEEKTENGENVENSENAEKTEGKKEGEKMEEEV